MFFLHVRLLWLCREWRACFQKWWHKIARYCYTATSSTSAPPNGLSAGLMIKYWIRWATICTSYMSSNFHLFSIWYIRLGILPSLISSNTRKTLKGMIFMLLQMLVFSREPICLVFQIIVLPKTEREIKKGSKNALHVEVC